MCDKCNEEGYIYFYEVVEGYSIYPVYMSKKCDCGKSGKIAFENRMEKSGIGDFFKEKNFSNYATPLETLKRIKDKCIEYTNIFSKIQFNMGNGLMLCGNVGSGKTHLGCAIVNRLMNNGFECEYFDYRERITNIKQNINDGKKYEEIMIKLKSVKILFIDDLFKGKITDSDINIVYEIINNRYQRKLPTIITSEKTPQQLLDIDSAIGSRIIEMTKDNLINISSVENYRLS